MLECTEFPHARALLECVFVNGYETKWEGGGEERGMRFMFCLFLWYVYFGNKVFLWMTSFWFSSYDIVILVKKIAKFCRSMLPIDGMATGQGLLSFNLDKICTHLIIISGDS